MRQNIGLADRILRVLVGGLLIAFALGGIAPGTGWNWLGWIGVVPLLTAFVAFCPAYTLLHLSSR